MGNSSSSNQDASLQVPSGPMKSLVSSWIAQDATNLYIKITTGGSRAIVTDMATSSQIYTINGKCLRSRAFLKNSQDKTLISIKSGIFSSKFHIFEGEQTEQEQFAICDISGMFNTRLMMTEFYDHKTGVPCRLVVRGGASQHVVLCYLERGDPKLSTLKSSDDFKKNHEKYQCVGRISRESKFLARDAYSIEAPVGVDLTLLLLFAYIRHVQLEAERSMS